MNENENERRANEKKNNKKKATKCHKALHVSIFSKENDNFFNILQRKHK